MSARSIRLRLLVVLGLFAALFAAMPAFSQTPGRCSSESRTAPLLKVPNKVNILILGDGFTDGQCGDFETAAAQLEASIVGTGPYANYASYLHFEHWLEPSTQSGASYRQCTQSGSHPAVTRLTTYGERYCADGKFERDLEPADFNAVWSRANAIMRSPDVVAIVVNDTTDGGTAQGGGGVIFSVSLNNASANPHELGHALAQLGDEYDYDDPGATCSDATGGQPCAPNITNISDASKVKWSPWYGVTPIIGYAIRNPPWQGAFYHPTGYYRPAEHCLMRDGAAMCSVCAEEFVFQTYRRHSVMVTDVSPATGTLTVPLQQTQMFRLVADQPTPYGLTWQWSVDGQLDPNQATNTYTYTAATSGKHHLSLRVADDTGFINKTIAARRGFNFEQFYDWDINTPASIWVSSGTTTETVIGYTSFVVPKGYPAPELTYSIYTQETPDHPPGDDWTLLVTDLSGNIVWQDMGKAIDSTMPPRDITLPVDASNGPVTLLLTITVHNGESSDFRVTNLIAGLAINGSCTSCDPCAVPKPPPSCPARIQAASVTVNSEATYDKTNDGRGDASYFSFPEGDHELDHGRVVTLSFSGLDSDVGNIKSLHVVVDLLRPDDSFVETIRDTTWRVNPSVPSDPQGDRTSRGLVSYGGSDWRVWVTPNKDDDGFQANPPTLSDEQKSHTIKFRIRATPILNDGRYTNTEIIADSVTSTSSPDDTHPIRRNLHSLWRQHNTMQGRRGRYWATRAANIWVNSHASFFARPNIGGLTAINELADEHAAYNTYLGHEWGTAFRELALYPESNWSNRETDAFDHFRNDIRGLLPGSSASAADKATYREHAVTFVSNSRSHLDSLIAESGISLIKFGNGNYWTGTTEIASPGLPWNWMQTLIVNGKLFDPNTGDTTLDLTDDARVGPLQWSHAGSGKVAFTLDANIEPDVWLNRCRIGESSCLHPAPNGNGIDITQQPASVTVNYPASTTLTVGATGSSLHYAWYQGQPEDFSNLVQDGTSASVTVAPSENTAYWVYIYNDDAYAISAAATVTVKGGPCVAPTILQSPQSTSAKVGDLVRLTTLARGTSLTYQWLSGASLETATPIGGNRPELDFTASAPSTFWVRIYNDCGSITSDPAVVDVCVPPTLTGPADQIVVQGHPATLSVDSDQTTGVTFTWYQVNDGIVNLLGTGQTITSAPLTATTQFWVRADNGRCFTDSRTATAEVCIPPWINQYPADQISTSGDPVSITVSAPDATVLTWYQGASGDTSNPFSGSGPTLQVAPLTTTSYWVRAGNGTCANDSPAATVYVCTPRILSQPTAAQTIVLGGSATLSVLTRGTEPFTYQWYAGLPGDTSSPVAGGTTQSITVSPTATTTYWVAISSPCPPGGRPPAQSNAAVVNVCIPAGIAANPSSQLVRLGSSATLSVTATGTNPAYQWFIGDPGATGNPVPGGATASITVTPGVTTTYWCRVSGDCGAAQNSAAATVTVCVPPTVTGPADQTVTTGTSATMTVSADQTSTFTWYRGTAGDTTTQVGTGATFTTPALTQPTNYWVRASNGQCTTDSRTATINICVPPSINQQPSDQVAAYGDLLTLSVNAFGATTYSWYQGPAGDTSHGMGGSSASMQVTATTTTSYWVRVGNGTCSVDSAVANVYVCTPRIVTQPTASQTITLGGSATLSVTLQGTTPFTYQWYIGAPGVTTSPVPGGTTQSITVSPAAATTYWVAVNSPCPPGARPAVQSAAAVVNVCYPPGISAGPSSTTVRLGSSATLSVTASGTNLVYDWFTGASGVTTSPLNLHTASISVTPGSTTSYWVRVSGDCGSPANSAAATVTVCVPPTVTGPADQTVTTGTSATMTVTANQSCTYTWYRGTAGDTTTQVGTGATFVTPALTQPTNYWVRANNGQCTTDSRTAAISICTPPSINQQPSDQVATYGDLLTLSVNAFGATTYSWYQGAAGDTSHGMGGSSASMQVTATTTTSYWVRVGNGTCSVDSAVANVYVCTPRIVTQPTASQTITRGNSTTLSVTAQGTTPFTYQWYIGSPGVTTSPVTNGTTQSITVSPQNTTTYWVAVNSPCPPGARPAVQSAAAVVNVCIPPSISAGPSSTTVRLGSSATLSVTATGTNLRYDWYAGATGITTSPLNLHTASITVTPGSTTQYWVQVNADCGTAQNSAAATVTVCVPPTVTGPADQTITTGTSATMTVSANQTSTFTWYRGTASDTTTQVGTGATFVTPTLTQPTNYWVRASNGTCTTDSRTATISICTPPGINQQPTDQITSSGAPVTLTVNASSDATVYTWYLGQSGDTSSPFSGSSPSLQVAPIVTTSYWVKVGNGTCSVNSSTATVHVCYPTMSGPYGVSIEAGSSTTLSVSANGTPPLTYQWYIGSSGVTTSPVANATTSSLSVTPASTTTYWVRVSTSCGYTNSNAATVTVTPCIRPQISSTSQGYDTTYLLYVSATGTNLHYEWYGAAPSTNGFSLISGATQSSVHVYPPDGAVSYYYARVYNSCGSATTQWFIIDRTSP